MITICLLKLNETSKKKYKTLLIVFEFVENKWHSIVNKLESAGHSWKKKSNDKNCFVGLQKSKYQNGIQ